MNGRLRRLGIATTAALLALSSITAPPTAAADVPAAPRLALPAPTGPYPVGARTLHLRDRDRADPWVPSRRRELMVTLWYPAGVPTGRPLPYVTPDESRLMTRALGLKGGPDTLLASTRTHARVGAPPLRRAGGLPLVVLSPGISLPRSSLTALAEELGSRGYAVAAIDHTYESVAVSFPDGTTTECLICRQRPPGPVVTASRAADVSFVLDQLTRRTPAGFGRYVDRRRIGMAGHSLGGASTLAAMRADRRVRAGVNLDGPFLPALDTAMTRPFLMLGAEAHGRPGADPSWSRTWEHLAGWRRWLSTTGTAHDSFTDYARLYEQLDLETPGQHVSGRRAVEITRRYVVAFFDRHLRQRQRPLLDGPSPAYPEIRFHP